MQDIIYLQCDMRYNAQLLNNFCEGKSVVEYVIERISNIHCQKIVAGIFTCVENVSLIEKLELSGVQVTLSQNDNVSERFIETVRNEQFQYVVRIGGDQVLCDIEWINEILVNMKQKNHDWFWEETANCVLPDIVSKDCLMKYEKNILKENRYFTALEKQGLGKRYVLHHPCILGYNFRVNSNEGYRVCKRVIEKKLNVYELSSKLAKTVMDKSNYLFRTGLLSSWILPEEFFIDEEKRNNPWWGKTIIDFIVPRIQEKFRVFEWGAGNSTLFWSQYVKNVVSVEYDKEWFKRIERLLPDNARLEYCALDYDGEYCRKILEESEKFDIILIDGRDRVNCAFHALEKLKEDGVIIWDNTERKYYQKGYDFLTEHGFKRIELSSLIYGLPGIEDFTSIFYRNNNILNI